MALTFGSLFSGVGCVDLLPKSLGYRLDLAVESDPEIAALYAANHGSAHLRIQDLLDPLPDLPRLDWLHASPPCVLDSGARRHPVTLEDRIHQEKLLTRIDTIAYETQAELITIENVPAFFKTAAFMFLADQLVAGGYPYVLWDVCESPFESRVRTIYAFAKSDRLLPSRKAQASGTWLSRINLSALPPDLTWQKSAVLTEIYSPLLKSQTPVIIQRVKQNLKKPLRPRLTDQKMFTVLASLADDGYKKRGRSKYIDVIWRGEVFNMVHDELKKVLSFPVDFDLGDNPRVAVRAIGNSCNPDVMNDFLIHYNQQRSK